MTATTPKNLTPRRLRRRMRRRLARLPVPGIVVLSRMRALHAADPAHDRERPARDHLRVYLGPRVEVWESLITAGLAAWEARVAYTPTCPERS